MDLLISIKKTLSIADGFQVGALIIDGDTCCLEKENGAVTNLKSFYWIEVLNGWDWQMIDYQDLFRVKALDGTPLYAGLECRIKGDN